jgi:single-stranded-DNA-specific exonuclease
LAQRWTTRDIDTSAVKALEDACGLSPLVARTLVARGIVTPEAAEKFLHPRLERDWSDPRLIPGMTAVADALEEAIRAQKRIVVFGDFDVDGISAAACMQRCLSALGASVECLIPHRMDEGYGLTAGALERIYQKNPELVITVDCGISAREEVAALVARGIAVLVTDHHEPSDAIPQGIPVTDPKMAEGLPQAILAGVGVALKLIALLGERFGQPLLWRDLVDLATLGTLADLMPLTGENRSLVAEGLTLLRQSPRPGIASTLALSRQGGQDVSSTDLSFSLIPRLNAAGRMGDPFRALELLINDDPLQAFEIAADLDAANNERRRVESALLSEALAQAEDIYRGQKILIVAGEGWHEGVRGIVASRLVSRFGVPVIVFTLAGGEARGSGRSVGKVNLFKAVERCAGLTRRFGGHEAAVGITILQERLDEFRQHIEAVMEDEPEENFRPPRLVDARLALADFDVESVDQLGLLEPYGQENREPLYVTCGVFLKNARAVGAKKNHLSFSVTDGKGSVQAIWFQCPAIDDFLVCDKAVDVIYRLQVDDWNGVRRVKLMVTDVFVAGEGDDGKEAQRLATEILGADVQLHPAQREALEALDAGRSVLAVMATGRGKSLIFQAHAARLALASGKASVFIYPLRALIADQAVHIAEGFARLGLVARALTGENTSGEKDLIFQALYEGRVDVLLTTPEFFSLHAWRFAESRRVAFIVFDEAHHLQTERASDRAAYRDWEELRGYFPHAQYLAVTATSDSASTDAICRVLGIDRVIIDDTRRENLRINDVRNLADRERHLFSIMTKASKAVVYANSRAQAVTLVRLLRKQNPAQADSIVFYHAGLARAQRRDIEEGFRAGRLRAIVSTSAFGEGVNVSDISDVVLYHLPFSAVAFNQMSGRAGRGGQPAVVHLLYTDTDADLNRRLLTSSAPRREELVNLYRALRERCRTDGDAVTAGGIHSVLPPAEYVITISPEQLAEACHRQDFRCDLDANGVSSGLAIFEELGLIRLLGLDDGYPAQTVKMVFDRRVELSASSRYLEGREELALFERFKTWAFCATADELRMQMIGPLTPSPKG